MIDFRVLGPLDLRGTEGNVVLSVISGPRRVALLAYLAIEGTGGFVRRDTLLGLFWPESDTEHARSSLRTALSTLRRGLGDGLIVTRGDEEVALFDGMLACDAVSFQQACDRGAYQQALELYRGHLLDGFFISDAPEFERWLDRTRERLRLRAVEAAWLLAEQHETGGNAEAAEQWAARAAELAAEDEDAVYRQIELLDRIGNRSGALRIFESYARRLATDGAEPSARIRALVHATGERPHSQKPARAPAPAAPDGSLPPHNLPVKLTPLIGRAEESEVVRARLLEADVHLLTLTGAGGIGKTRLAVQVAAQVLSHFTDGVRYVDFESATTPDLVAAILARAVGIQETGAETVLQQLLDNLRRKRALLVLDTFEQVLSAAPVVAELLQECPGLKILATSRAPLHLSMEHTHPVPPLPAPDASKPALPEALLENESVQLFVARARAANRDFALDPSTAPAVARICAELDGLPLAIELAAARTKVLPVDALAARLGSKLQILTGGARDLPRRQQTLRNTLEWSYGLLAEPEQKLFRRMSVFVGQFTLEAAEAICDTQNDLGVEVLDGIDALVSNSLAHLTPGAAEDAAWAMFGTVCEYARELLEKSGEAAAMKDRHARFYADLAETASRHLKGNQQVVWLRRLEEGHANLRGALSWTLRPAGGMEGHPPQDPETALQITAALWRFWWAHGHLSEGRRWLKLALGDNANGMAKPTESAATTGVRAEALRGAGILAWDQGDYGEAHTLLETSLALSRHSGDDAGIASSLNNLALVAQDQGDAVKARALYEESLAIRREIADAWGIASSLNNLGKLALEQGNYAEAQSFLEESLALDRKLGTQRGTATSLYNLGTVAFGQQDYSGASLRFRESLELYQGLGDKRGIIECLEGSASAASHLGKGEHAATLLGAADRLRHEIGAPPSPSEQCRNERVVSAVRAQLGAMEWDSAWKAGREMTLEQSVRYALREP